MTGHQKWQAVSAADRADPVQAARIAAEQVKAEAEQEGSPTVDYRPNRCPEQEPYQEVFEGRIAREGFYRAGAIVTVLDGDYASVARLCELRLGHDGEHRYEW